MDLNKVLIIGRLTRDPELRTIPSGVSVVNFSVATNRVYVDQSGARQETVEFHDIVAWRRLAEICSQYLGKGRRVYIEGRLQTRSWDDPNGLKRYKTEIVADNMIILDPPASGTALAGARTLGQSPAAQRGDNLSSPTPIGPAAQAPTQPSKSTKKLVEPSPDEDIPTIDISEETGERDEDNEEAEVSVEDIPF